MPDASWKRPGRGKRKNTSMPTAADVERILREAEEECLIEGDDFEWHVPEHITPRIQDPSASRLTIAEREQLKKGLAELAKRSQESLRLYKPMPLQEEFHVSHAPERVFRGGNRAGKTLAAAAEFARAITGQDPHGKYAKTNGRAICVGKDLMHCSKVMYRKLFRAGPFKMIRDEITKEWRVYDPETDQHRALEARDAPPLVPARFYDHRAISWENKREQIPKTIKMKSGWEITFFSSLGAPPQGWDVDLVWFDEEIEHPEWYPEMAARLLDRRVLIPETGVVIGGKFIWSATPQAGTIQLFDLCERAKECDGDEVPAVVDIHATMLQNTYMTEEAKKEFAAKFANNDDEIRVRVHGDFALAGMRIYPEFQPRGIHGIEAFPVPDDWTRYIFVDPGRQVCATLFVAVPPPAHSLRGKAIIYDELYLKKCSAKKFADALRAKCVGQSIWAGWIDHHAGRVTEMGSGKTIEEQYIAELKARDFKFVGSGTATFHWGNDDVKGGIELVRGGLAINDGMPTKWLVMKEKVPNFLWEAERYSFKKIQTTGLVTEDPLKRDDHLMDCWRYAASADLRWRSPRVFKKTKGYTADILRKKREKARRSQGWGGAMKVG